MRITRVASTALAVLVAVASAPCPVSAQAALFAYERTAVTGVTDSLVETVDGVQVRQVRFPSPLGGEVTGVLAIPSSGAGRHAGIVMGHGAPGSAAKVTPRAIYLARHGAVVLIVNAPFARRNPDEPMSMTVSDSADLVQQVVDYRRALDVLAGRPDVDSSRLGFVGGSASAYVGALLAGTEPRLRAVALAMGDPGYVAHFQEPDGRWNRFFPDDVPEAQVKAWVASLAALDARAWLARSTVPSILLQNALKDEAVPRHAAEALHAAAPARARRTWYDSGHRLTPQAFVDQLDFFADALALSPPGEADLAGPYGMGPRATLPTTAP